jgi:hypothetical protein
MWFGMWFGLADLYTRDGPTYVLFGMIPNEIAWGPNAVGQFAPSWAASIPTVPGEVAYDSSRVIIFEYLCCCCCCFGGPKLCRISAYFQKHNELRDAHEMQNVVINVLVATQDQKHARTSLLGMLAGNACWECLLGMTGPRAL